MGPGDFTTQGHFIVLTGVDGDGKILLHDPNSRKNSEKAWEYERLAGQMKNLWKYSYNH
jgi:predicted double-glycine peptidase